MSRDDLIWRPAGERLDGGVHAIRAGIVQVPSPQASMKRSVGGEAADEFQRVYNAGVRAPENDHQPALRVEEKRLVIEQGIGTAAPGIQEEASPGVFKVVFSRDFPGNEEAGQHLGRLGGPRHAIIAAQQFDAAGRQTDEATFAVGILAELWVRHCGMRIELRFWGLAAGVT